MSAQTPIASTISLTSLPHLRGPRLSHPSKPKAGLLGTPVWKSHVESHLGGRSFPPTIDSAQHIDHDSSMRTSRRAGPSFFDLIYHTKASIRAKALSRTKISSAVPSTVFSPEKVEDQDSGNLT